MMTAYDFPTANAVSEAGIDIILVGDSLAQVVLGHDDTLSITMDEMLHHVKAVTRALPKSYRPPPIPRGTFFSWSCPFAPVPGRSIARPTCAPSWTPCPCFSGACRTPS